MATEAAIVIDGLTKRFRRLVAVRNLSLRVPAGEIFGFLGLNGAGKTTTIRILLDLLRPTAGRARILGHDCQADGTGARAGVGYLPGELRFYPDMTGRQILDVFTRLSALNAAAVLRRKALLERLSLAEADLDRRVREYSTGMKRKLGIVLAFQSDPSVLILDEPTEGLDPLMQEVFYALLDEVRAAGRTVFMSSHVLSEVERVCDRIAVLRKGEIVLDAPVDDIRRRAPRTVRVTFAAEVVPPGAWMPGIDVVEILPRRWELKSRTELGAFVASLSGLPVADLDITERRLEDIVIDYYKGTA
jgi:ABC-2 type transport system ATP-binding protein